MEKGTKNALINFFKRANTIMEIRRKTDFSELKMRDKQAIFDSFINSSIKYDLDGDGVGGYLVADSEDYHITFFSRSEYLFRLEIRESLTSLSICIGDDEDLSISEALAKAQSLPVEEKVIKLNDILRKYNVSAYGFPAFAALSEVGNKEGESTIVSTLSPAIMLSKGINIYYAPKLQRGAIYNSAAEVILADLDCNLVTVNLVDDMLGDSEVIIASRHKGTIEILKNMYPNNRVLESVTPDDIRDKYVVGTLPPALIQYCAAYKAVTIKDFDYAKDGDLSGEDLQARIEINDTIIVEVIS